MALIVVEPDLGGALMFVPMLGAMLLVAGDRRATWSSPAARRWWSAPSVGASCTDYQRERVLTFLNPERDPLGAGYQVRQSKIAVGSGELVGRGYMQGTQSQLRFLPARHTDFIFAVLAEEWGFLGVAFVLFLYGVFLFGCAEVAARARDRLGILLVVGFFAAFAFHVLYNTGDGGRPGAQHRHPAAVPLLRRLVHALRVRGDRAGAGRRLPALREPVAARRGREPPTGGPGARG